MLKEIYKKYHSLLFYAVFGVLTTIVNVLVYILCFQYLFIKNLISTIIAWIIAVLFAFFTNKIWVFNSKSFAISVFLSELWKFVSCRLATGVLELLAMFIGVDILLGPPTFIKFGCNILVILLNYVFSKMLIFGRKRQ